MTAKQFIRLPASRRGVLRRASLWDAGEYLLSISGTSFTERYRRFYYRDIKAIVVQKGPRLGSIGALLFALWLFIPFFIISHWTWLVPALWLAWLIYVNVARSCRVFLYTAVSSEELPAIFRCRAAALTLPKILNKIAEAQGEFAFVEGMESIAAETAPESEPVPVSRQVLYAVSLFCLLFIGSAAFAYWYRDMELTASNLLSGKFALPVLNGLEVGAGVWGLFKLAGNRVMSSLKICLFAGLGILAIRSYSLLLILSVMRQENGVLSDAIANIHLRYWVGTADCALSTIVALAGLISLILAWQDDRQVAVSNL